MNGVDHVRVQRIQNSLLCCPLSARARWMLERIADGSMPPILIEGWWPPNSEFFGEGARAFEEFEGAYQELDDRGLIAVGDLIEEEEKKIDGADEFRFQYWVTLRLAFDLPHRGKGLLP